ALDHPPPWSGTMDENTYIGEILAYSDDDYQYTDYPLAASHFTKAEETGTDGKAEYNLFLLYRDGLGVDMSYLNATVKLNKALQKGNSLAMIENEYADKRYYQVFFNDFSDYTDELPAVADEEEDEELLRHDLLATMHKIAANDVVDFSRLYQLGECFLHGRGVTANEEEAFRWFELAHKYNYGDAALALGKMALGMRNTEAVHKYLDPIMNGTAELAPTSSALYQLKDYAKSMLSQIDEPNTCYYSYNYDNDNKTASLGQIIVTNPSGLFDLVIPEKTIHDGNEYSVTSIARHAIGEDVNCCSITLPPTLRTLYKEAIYRIENLKSITLPANLEELGWDSFRECFNLGEIDIDPANRFFISIDGNVYSKDGTTLCRIAPAKTAYVMPKDVSKIADGAAILTKLQTVKLNKSLTEIGDGAFAYCPELLAIEIPSSVKSLGSGTFAGCEKLAEVKLPKGLIALPEELFGGCQSLSHIEIPSPVATIGQGVFNNCGALTSIKVDSKSPYIKSPDGKTLLSSDGKKLYFVAATAKYEVPEGVTDIEGGALEGIETITIPASVKHIGEYQLSKCKQIVFKGKIEQLDDNYFDTSETTFYVPEGLQEHYRDLLQEYQRESVAILPLSAAKR
ncbi:MAG: leucine-rich repeat protein, partial [Muribaculaceae bacterium]|nr:leucine-rich repeat protein [Muribaculaceae bacterium]